MPKGRQAFETPDKLTGTLSKLAERPPPAPCETHPRHGALQKCICQRLQRLPIATPGRKTMLPRSPKNCLLDHLKKCPLNNLTEKRQELQPGTPLAEPPQKGPFPPHQWNDPKASLIKQTYSTTHRQHAALQECLCQRLQRLPVDGQAVVGLGLGRFKQVNNLGQRDTRLGEMREDGGGGQLIRFWID